MPLDFLADGSETSRFYEEHIRRFGYSYRALGFGRRASQEKRFEAALGMGSLHGKRLLDVGCGFGDLLAWLNARGIEPDYTGIDICKPMIERCRKRFANTGAKFMVGDALTFVPADPYDYIVASGIFGYNAGDTRKRVQPTLERLFDLTHIALSVNFLSRRAPTRSPGRLYLHPADVLQFALKLTPAVRLDHSYLPNDFTLCLYRRAPWDQG
ncbi:MAG TPA: class I SAM-dependent methyltransferase [Burkholderiales bacterium]|nr:class I SAM-dependent methyltransferase [Burkholderiales bacterium]